MLLGIVLHGAMSFIPGAGLLWGVQDARASDSFGVMLASIHGWRMPLFFLVSGFFTAMLWKKRGLQALFAHRFKRIFLPLVASMLTITPLMWIVSGYVRSHVGTKASAASEVAVDDKEKSPSVQNIAQMVFIYAPRMQSKYKNLFLTCKQLFTCIT